MGRDDSIKSSRTGAASPATNYQLLRNFFCVFAINDTGIHETVIH